MRSLTPSHLTVGLMSAESTVTCSERLPPCVIMTDLEPDDLLALAVLKQRWPSYCPSVIVVGEGSADAKVERMTEYCRELAWDAAIVLPGLNSSKLFPGEHATSETDADGASGNVVAVIASLPETAELSILCLKPPRELVGAPRSLLLRCALTLYGSFNVRSVGDNSGVQSLLESCHSVVMFENFAGIVPPVRSLNSGVLPAGLFAALFEAVPARSTFLKSFRACCETWDEDVMLDCKATCEQCDLLLANPSTSPDEAKQIEARKQRNAQCYQDVKQHCGKQTVAADGILALMVGNPVFDSFLKTTTYNLGGSGQEYPVITEVDDPSCSNIRMYRRVPWDAVCDELTRLFVHVHD